MKLCVVAEFSQCNYAYSQCVHNEPEFEHLGEFETVLQAALGRISGDQGINLPNVPLRKPKLPDILL
jgi:hypothetical protein